MHQHDILMESPLVMSHDDTAALGRSDVFCLLRAHLADGGGGGSGSGDGGVDFCSCHAQCDAIAKDTFLFHRDTLHALLMPIVALFQRSTTLASAALCTRSNEDLELAFSGDARSTFLCLQCFIAEEEAWCQTKGCPACVVAAILSTESHIRMAIAASLLSMATNADNDTASLDSRLPPLQNMLSALRAALTADVFWEGADNWSYLLSRATQLSAGVRALSAECCDLESLVSCPPSEPALGWERSRRRRTTQAQPSVLLPHQQLLPERGVRLRKSKLAKWQLRLRDEEMEVKRRVALHCWIGMQLPRQIRGDLLGVSRITRPRSLTCP